MVCFPLIQIYAVQVFSLTISKCLVNLYLVVLCRFYRVLSKIKFRCIFRFLSVSLNRPRRVVFVAIKILFESIFLKKRRNLL